MLKNVNLAIMHRSLILRIISYEEIKNANLAMLRRSLVLNIIFFKDMSHDEITLHDET